MLDAFTDSNYLLGGTNHKGYTLHALYGVAHNTWLGLRYNLVQIKSAACLSPSIRSTWT